MLSQLQPLRFVGEERLKHTFPQGKLLLIIVFLWRYPEAKMELAQVEVHTSWRIIISHAHEMMGLSRSKSCLAIAGVKMEDAGESETVMKTGQDNDIDDDELLMEPNMAVDSFTWCLHRHDSYPCRMIRFRRDAPHSSLTSVAKLTRVR